MNIARFEKILFYLMLAVFVTGGFLRAFFVDFSDFDYGVYSDHFINAVTAKNISTGLNWSSSGYETYLLNPENLTVGPTIVLPVALAITIFGNKLAVPGLTIFLLNISLLAFVFRALIKIINNNMQFYFTALFLVFVFIFFKSYYWYRMIGEVPAILLLLLVIVYISDYLQTFRMKSLLLASIAGTFAMGTKELVLLPVLMLTFIIIPASFNARTDKNWTFWLARPLLFLSVCLVLPIIFYLYQQALLQTQSEAWRSAYFVYAKSIHDYYSGANTLREYFSEPTQVLTILPRVLKSTLWNGGTLLHLSLIGMRGLQFWLCAFIALLVYILACRKTSVLSALLAASAILPLLWFLCISEKAMPRHLSIGLFLAVLAILFFITSIKNTFWRYTLASAMLVMIVLTGDQSSRLILKSWPTKDAPNIDALNDAQHYIEEQPGKSLAWIGMVDNNEFEYLSHTPNNFISAYDLIADSIVLDESAYLASHPDVASLIANHHYHSALDFYVSPDNTYREAAKVNFVRPLDFNWLHFKSGIARSHRSNIHLKRGELCKNILYQNQYYVVEHCTKDDLQAFFDTTGGLPVRPRKWRPYILLPSERTELF